MEWFEGLPADEGYYWHVSDYEPRPEVVYFYPRKLLSDSVAEASTAVSTMNVWAPTSTRRCTGRVRRNITGWGRWQYRHRRDC